MSKEHSQRLENKILVQNMNLVLYSRAHNLLNAPKKKKKCSTLRKVV